MRAKITKSMVDAARPGPRDIFIWDAEVAGFGLKITPHGRRIYVLQYRFHGTLRRYTIGRHGSPWTAEEARARAKKLLSRVADGHDPADAKREAREDLTVGELADLYLSEGCDTNKASTVATDRRILTRHVKPLLGSRKVKSITRADIERANRDVANGKTATDEKTKKHGRAIVRGGKAVANRMVDVLSGMFKFACVQGMRADNPARGIEAYKLDKRERFLNSKEISGLGDALVAAEHRGENQYAIAALRLLLLTGCRKSEILQLKWAYVDFERGCFRLPDSKTGAKVVPVGAAVLALLNALPKAEKNDFVLPGRKPGARLVGLQKFWEKVRRDCGLNNVRLHDFRHSFASFGVAAGDTLFMIGKVLGHKQARTTEGYAHLAADPVRAVADRISGQIAAAMTKPQGPSAEIVTLPVHQT